MVDVITERYNDLRAILKGLTRQLLNYEDISFRCPLQEVF
jgi:hypothetical protein